MLLPLHAESRGSRALPVRPRSRQHDRLPRARRCKNRHKIPVSRVGMDGEHMRRDASGLTVGTGTAKRSKEFIVANRGAFSESALTHRFAAIPP